VTRRLAVERHLREFDRLAEDLKIIERDLARSALADEAVKRLMTMPGVDTVVALAIAAAIGEVGRFDRPEKLVSYLGLNPSVRQSGPGPAYHGRITKQGRGQARGMLVEAAWRRRALGSVARVLPARTRRGQYVAATARKLRRPDRRAWPKRRGSCLQYQESSRSGSAGGSSKPRPPTRASWPVGIPAGPNGRARAPQTRVRR
jgi:transposase